MLEFTKTLKLYYFREENQVSLSVLGSPTQVLTFYIHADKFDRIMREAQSPAGANVEPFFIQRKRLYLRFSHQVSDMQTNLRIENAKWEAMSREYLEKKANSREAIETITVD
jgi:hypothetical protein